MNTDFSRKTLSLTIWLIVAFILLGPGSAARVIAAPPEPTDCSAETYNDIASKNCGIEATVPDTNWEVSNVVITIERSADQVHNGDYALKITGTAATANNTSVGAQTVKTSNPIAVTPNTSYSFVGWAYIPSTATRVQAARLRVAWYAAADCSGSQLSTATADVTTTDIWTYGWLYATSPATANCAQLRLFIQTTATGSGTDPVGPVYFDNVMFYESNANAVTFSGLSAASPFAALAVGLLAAAGLVILRKRK